MTAERITTTAELDAQPAGSDTQGQVVRVTVTVDTDELRAWAEKHAGAGHHGVAHVLYQAAAGAESLTEQALAEAEARGARSALLSAADAIDESRHGISTAGRAMDMGRAWSAAYLRDRAEAVRP